MKARLNKKDASSSGVDGQPRLFSKRKPAKSALDDSRGKSPSTGLRRRGKPAPSKVSTKAKRKKSQFNVDTLLSGVENAIEVAKNSLGTNSGHKSTTRATSGSRGPTADNSIGGGYGFVKNGVPPSPPSPSRFSFVSSGTPTTSNTSSSSSGSPHRSGLRKRSSAHSLKSILSSLSNHSIASFGSARSDATRMTSNVSIPSGRRAPLSAPQPLRRKVAFRKPDAPLAPSLTDSRDKIPSLPRRLLSPMPFDNTASKKKSSTGDDQRWGSSIGRKTPSTRKPLRPAVSMGASVLQSCPSSKSKSGSSSGTSISSGSSTLSSSDRIPTPSQPRRSSSLKGHHRVYSDYIPAVLDQRPLLERRTTSLSDIKREAAFNMPMKQPSTTTKTHALKTTNPERKHHRRASLPEVSTVGTTPSLKPILKKTQSVSNMGIDNSYRISSILGGLSGVYSPDMTARPMKEVSPSAVRDFPLLDLASGGLERMPSLDKKDRRKKDRKGGKKKKPVRDISPFRGRPPPSLQPDPNVDPHVMAPKSVLASPPVGLPYAKKEKDPPQTRVKRRSRSKSKEPSRSKSKERSKSKSKERSRSKSKEPSGSRSKEKRKERRSRSKSKEARSKSKERSRSKSRAKSKERGRDPSVSRSTPGQKAKEPKSPKRKKSSLKKRRDPPPSR